MSVTLNPRTHRRNMANPALLLLPAANLLFIYFFFYFFFCSVFIILMFSQHLLDDFCECFEATSSRFQFMHIAYVNSSAQGRMKDGRKDVYMVMDICTYVSAYPYLYPWLATVAVSANNLHICIWNLPASFCFFFLLPFFGFAQKI